MELMIGWFILAGLIGWWADQWGRSLGTWVAVAVILSPVIAAIGLLVMGRKSPAPIPVGSDPTATLASLADLRDRGAITEDEYSAKKADLLARL